ncbi:MAG: hypothetical protein MK086_05345 [Flavobacteriales bacterium]|nr:hypothetical protein [Flavobacteriales bacterium]
MKGILSVLAICITCQLTGQVNANESKGIEISGFYGYRFGGSVDVFYRNELGSININDNAAYGVDLSYRIRERYFINLQWTRQDTDMDFYGYRDISVESLGDLALEYFMISALSDLGPATGPVTPFFGLGGGLVVATPKERRFETAYRFGFTLQAGARIWLNDRVGLRLRGALLAPMQWGSGGLFCNTSSGCDLGVSASTTILQGELSGGVVVKL